MGEINREIQGQARTGLARALSKLGYCSRSLAFVLIRSGRVQVNGRPIRDPERPVRIGKDRIRVDGSELTSARKVYLMLNKPRGVVTTARDEKGRKTIYSLLPQQRTWLAPVGRLDMASEGLLLLTNDSAWGARLASPESHIEKTYHVHIAAKAQNELIEHLMEGVRTKDGEYLAVKRGRIVRHGKKNSWIELILEEGKNRHIRRLLAEFDIEVLRLVRVAIGGVELGDLPKGKTRELTKGEVEVLASACRTESG